MCIRDSLQSCQQRRDELLLAADDTGQFGYVPLRLDVEPVSYTHLACMGGVLLAGCIMGALSVLGVSAFGAVAVSYTHLDVYKRQPFLLPFHSLEAASMASTKSLPGR